MRSEYVRPVTRKLKESVMINLALPEDHQFQAFDVAKLGEFLIAGRGPTATLFLRAVTQPFRVHFRTSVNGEGKWYSHALPACAALAKLNLQLDYPDESTIPEQYGIMLYVEIRMPRDEATQVNGELVGQAQICLKKSERGIVTDAINLAAADARRTDPSADW